MYKYNISYDSIYHYFLNLVKKKKASISCGTGVCSQVLHFQSLLLHNTAVPNPNHKHVYVHYDIKLHLTYILMYNIYYSTRTIQRTEEIGRASYSMNSAN